MLLLLLLCNPVSNTTTRLLPATLCQRTSASFTAGITLHRFPVHSVMRRLRSACGTSCGGSW